MNVNSILRLKITGKCNRECFFCHQEGGMSYLEDINYCNDLDSFIRKFSGEFDVKSIAITGGEPLLNPNVLNIFEGISKINQIERISLTTNGTISPDLDFWCKLSINKLKEVNISVPDIINNEDFDLLEKQITIIKNLNKLNIQANVNMVVFNDIVFSINVIKTLLKHKNNINFSITLLPNLNKYDYSKNITNGIIDMLKLKKNEVCENNFTSNIKTTYTLDDNIIYIKDTKKDGRIKIIKGLCDNCPVKNECNEGFYALRVEKKGFDYFARICLLRNDNETAIKTISFFDSNIYTKLQNHYRAK
jgi:molybdenum cofactor biosynthesis enzyme MoaA